MLWLVDSAKKLVFDIIKEMSKWLIIKKSACAASSVLKCESFFFLFFCFCCACVFREFSFFLCSSRLLSRPQRVAKNFRESFIFILCVSKWEEARAFQKKSSRRKSMGNVCLWVCVKKFCVEKGNKKLLEFSAWKLMCACLKVKAIKRRNKKKTQHVWTRRS